MQTTSRAHRDGLENYLAAPSADLLDADTGTEARYEVNIELGFRPLPTGAAGVRGPTSNG